MAIFPDVNVDPATGTRDPDQQIAFDGLYLPTAPTAAPFVRVAVPGRAEPGAWL